MTISVECPHCQRSYEVPSEFAGRAFRCRACGDTVSIPEPQPSDIDADAGTPGVDAPLQDEPATEAVSVPVLRSAGPHLPAGPRPLREERRRDRDDDEMPSTIRLALVFGAIHMVEDLFLILSGFSVAGDAPQTAGPIILAGLVRLGIELSLFTGLLRRRSVARLAFIVLTALGLGVQVLVLLTMSSLALSGQMFPRILAGAMACCGGIGILLRIGGIAALLPSSAAQWCDVSSSSEQ